MPRRALLVALVPLSSASACESCDFSFGPIPVTVSWTPEDRPATVEICGEEACFDVASGADPSWPPGQIQTHTGWDGYAVCRYPALVVTVEAEGCEPGVVEHERRRPGEGGPIELAVELACD